MPTANTVRIKSFDTSGITRGNDGIARYGKLLPSLVEVLRSSVDRTPEAGAVVELGGERVNYRQLWDRSARVADGLKAEGIGRGDRVAIQLGNGLDWCLAFFGIQIAGAVAAIFYTSGTTGFPRS